MDIRHSSLKPSSTNIQQNGYSHKSVNFQGCKSLKVISKWWFCQKAITQSVIVQQGVLVSGRQDP